MSHSIPDTVIALARANGKVSPNSLRGHRIPTAIGQYIEDNGLPPMKGTSYTNIGDDKAAIALLAASLLEPSLSAIINGGGAISFRLDEELLQKTLEAAPLTPTSPYAAHMVSALQTLEPTTNHDKILHHLLGNSEDFKKEEVMKALSDPYFQQWRHQWREQAGPITPLPPMPSFLAPPAPTTPTRQPMTAEGVIADRPSISLLTPVDLLTKNGRMAWFAMVGSDPTEPLAMRFKVVQELGKLQGDYVERKVTTSHVTEEHAHKHDHTLQVDIDDLANRMRLQLMEQQAKDEGLLIEHDPTTAS